MNYLPFGVCLTSCLSATVVSEQYNNWFTFTDFEEPVTRNSFRPIHAKELATVSLVLLSL